MGITRDEKAHEQINELAHPHDLDAEGEAWEAEQAAQKQTVIDTLSEQEQLTVRAMETAGFIFNPQGRFFPARCMRLL